MFKRALPLTLLLLIAGLGTLPDPAISASPEPAEQALSPEETASFRQRLIDYYAAWNIVKGQPWSMAKPGKYYQQNNRLFSFDSTPPAEGLQGWPTYESALAKAMGNYDSLTVTLGDRFLVYRNGDVVWTVSTYNIAGTLKDGTAEKSVGRHTLIWERVGDQWIIAHEHVSTPPPQP